MNKKLLFIVTIVIVLITPYLIYNYAPFIQNPKVMSEVERELSDGNLRGDIENKRIIDRINSNGLTVYVVEINTTETKYHAFIQKESTLGFNIDYQTISMLSDKGEFEVSYKDGRLCITGIKTNDSITTLRLLFKYKESTHRYVDVDIRGKRYFYYYADKALKNEILIDQ